MRLIQKNALDIKDLYRRDILKRVHPIAGR